MAILGKIRQRSIFLIIVIGMALFAFVISGVFDGNSANSGPTEPIALINDDEIEIDFFRQMVDQTQRNYNYSTLKSVNLVWNQALRNTIFEQEDLVYIVGTREQVSDFFTWVSPDIKPFERVVIGGGGDLGLMLASVTEKDFDCVLLELDESRALACSAALDSTLVLQADALTESAMEEAGIHDRTAFIA